MLPFCQRRPQSRDSLARSHEILLGERENDRKVPRVRRQVTQVESELDAALVIFLETANVILQGLVALSYVRPVLGSTFNLVTNFTSHTIL